VDQTAETTYNTGTVCDLGASQGDTPLIAAGGRGGRILLWDARASRPARVLAGGGKVTSLHFSSDGQFLVSGTTEGIEVWDVQKQQVHRCLQGPLRGKARRATENAWFLHNDDRVASFSNRTLSLWSVASGNQIVESRPEGVLAPMVDDKAAIASAALSPNSDLMCVVSRGGRLCFVDMQLGCTVGTTSPSTAWSLLDDAERCKRVPRVGELLRVDWSNHPNQDPMLITGAADGGVLLWAADAARGQRWAQEQQGRKMAHRRRERLLSQ